MTADLHIAPAQFTGNHSLDLPNLQVGRHEQLFREILAKALVDLAHRFRGDRATGHTARVDPSLHIDVRARLELQVAFDKIGAVVVEECALDIDRVRRMALDEVRVIAVHRANQGRERARSRRQAAPEARRGRHQVDSEPDGRTWTITNGRTGYSRNYQSK